ncbi:MAG: sigma 54-interacting transcriptional regulator [Acidobacteria bacterium]|nr:sigma 54-interacting transcriptional regulator [Acidobacteriota bacterium]
MATHNHIGIHSVDELIEAGKTAMEASRFEDAAAQFSLALRYGPASSDEEAYLRSLLSDAYYKRGMSREQLEAVFKYTSFADLSRLSESLQMFVWIRLGWAYTFNNDIPRAIAFFNQALPVAQRLEDDKSIGDCFFGLGRAYRFVSEIRIARDYNTSALEYYRRVGDWRRLAENYLNIATIDAREGDFQNAINSIKQTLAIVGDRTEHHVLGHAYNDLALIYDHLGMPTELILTTWEKCLEHFRQSGDAAWLGVSYNNLACKLIQLGDLKRAESLCRSALEMIRSTGRLQQLGAVLDSLAQIYLLFGRFAEAEQLLQESLEIFATMKDNRKFLNKEVYLELQPSMTIGKSQLLQGEVDKAIRSFEHALEISLRLGERQFRPEAQLNLAEALLQHGDYERASELIEKVRTHLHDSPDMLVWGTLARLDAKIALAKNSLAAAIQLLDQSSSLFEIRDNKYHHALNRIERARILERQHNYAAAIAELTQAIKVFETIGATLAQQKATEFINQLKALPAVSQGEPTPAHQPVADSVAAVDGFITRRIVQAAVSRELLLHELASVCLTLAAARGIVILESDSTQEAPTRDGLTYRIADTIGLQNAEKSRELEFINRLKSHDYGKYFVYPFSDKQQSKFLLHLIEPQASGLAQLHISMPPLLALVEQGLELNLLKSKRRKTRIFNSARLLAEIELPGFICVSRAMNRVLEQIYKIRSSNVTVLITGESGTGKELIARAIHAGSSRKLKKFIPFNCSAAPRDIVESQLFGYKKGAFTGAFNSNPGIIRTADKGTLFLDEIGDLPLDLQPKLLRFLQEGEIHPLGENQPEHVDVRVVAATNAKLEKAVADGRFREDLFHRLNVIRIQVPPLRERREEIPALINHYLELYQQEATKLNLRLSEETVDLMVVYDWPGNVRELCNEVRRLVAYSEPGGIITPDLLSSEIIKAGKEIKAPTNPPGRSFEETLPTPASLMLSKAIEDLERRMIQDALRRSSGNIAQAAKELGLSRKGLYLKMDRLKFND